MNKKENVTREVTTTKTDGKLTMKVTETFNIGDLERELKDLQTKYRNKNELYKGLSQVERDSDQGKAIRKEMLTIHQQIVNKHKEIKDTKTKLEIARMKRHIQVNPDFLTIKKPKYVSIKGVKVLTPKEIVAYEAGKHFVFGDTRLKNIQYDETSLEKLYEQKKLIFVLRKTKKKGDKNTIFAFTIPLTEVFKSRKWRLSSAMMLEAENERDWMIEELGEELKDQDLDQLSDEELTEIFLSSLKSEIIVKDLNRFIQLHFEEARTIKK